MRWGGENTAPIVSDSKGLAITSSLFRRHYARKRSWSWVPVLMPIASASRTTSSSASTNVVSRVRMEVQNVLNSACKPLKMCKKVSSSLIVTSTAAIRSTKILISLKDCSTVPCGFLFYWIKCRSKLEDTGSGFQRKGD
ncbi:unnamed protein product [Citrullus colocynthis]|uniref:Uncharacterized protein n=1 Tax=Citrullus colocynthis TaxID=252529 RepID=A0ABP0Z9Y2_9ROSI